MPYGLHKLPSVNCEDRIRAAKDTGLANLPRSFDQNQIWSGLAAMVCELTAWMRMLALDRHARAWGLNACAAPVPRRWAHRP
jgi:hypothetical protein